MAVYLVPVEAGSLRPHRIHDVGRPDPRELAGRALRPGGRLVTVLAGTRDGEGNQVTTGKYPVVNIGNAWELYSMLGVILPGTEHHYQETDGQRTAWLLHPDGSWARATATAGNPPIVNQSGPRRLWDSLDEIRCAWLRDGKLPAYGANVTITPDGTITLTRGRWHATITQTLCGSESTLRFRKPGFRPSG